MEVWNCPFPNFLLLALCRVKRPIPPTVSRFPRPWSRQICLWSMCNIEQGFLIFFFIVVFFFSFFLLSFFLFLFQDRRILRILDPDFWLRHMGRRCLPSCRHHGFKLTFVCICVHEFLSKASPWGLRTIKFLLQENWYISWKGHRNLRSKLIFRRRYARDLRIPVDFSSNPAYASRSMRTYRQNSTRVSMVLMIPDPDPRDGIPWSLFETHQHI